MKNKRAAMEISFGMIFSIILIIIFIAFAIYGIGKFLSMNYEVKIKTFERELQNDVTRVFDSPESSDEYVYSLPKKIIKVCFEDKGENRDNMRLILEKGFGPTENIEHLNIPKEVCINNIEGKIKIRLEKNFGESLVRVVKA